MSKVIVGGTGGARTAAAAPAQPSIPGGLFVALGLAVTAVGLIDLGFAWFPWQFGNGEWEFGTVSRTFDSLALVSVGIGFFSLGAVLRRSSWMSSAAVALSGVLLAALLGGVLIYALNLPLALRMVPPEAAGALRRAIMRTGAFMLVYLTFYTWLTWFNWRSIGLSRK